MHPQLPEIIGFVAGVACVLLGMYENVWNWPVGITSNLALFILFWRTGVYAASALQLVYTGIAIYGWWNWVRRPGGVKLRITRARSSELVVLLTATAAAAVVLQWILRRFTDTTVAWPDAIGTSILLGAQYCLSRKLLECWFFWICADVIYVVLYFSKGLYLAPLLYLFFLIMCVAGYIRWRRESLDTSTTEAAISVD